VLFVHFLIPFHVYVQSMLSSKKQYLRDKSLYDLLSKEVRRRRVGSLGGVSGRLSVLEKSQIYVKIKTIRLKME
jgi:hypothetical protein